MTVAVYVAIVEGDQGGGYSAFFPDLPGCVTAADTMIELPTSAREALALHLQGMSEDGTVFPEPTALEDIRPDPDVREVGRLIIDVDIQDAAVRVNISIGAQFLNRVDVAAEARGMTRSGFLVEAARQMLAQRSSLEPSFPKWREAPSPPAAPPGFREQAADPMDSSRYLIVPTESDSDLAVIWDRLTEEVIDVIEYRSTNLRSFESGGVVVQFPDPAALRLRSLKSTSSSEPPPPASSSPRKKRRG